MCPVLIQLGLLSIKTYGLFVIIGFLAALFYIKRKAHKYNFSDEFVYDLAFWALFSGILGARITYILLDIKYFIGNPLEMFMIWKGGLVYYGGLLGGILGGIAIIYKYRIYNWKKVADVLSPSIALAHAFGRIGCFFAGCCYGKITSSKIGITFSHPESFAPAGVSVYPTQLMEAFGNILIFLFLNYKLGKEKYEGQIFTLYILLYALLRFINEFFRGDYRGPELFSVTLLQWVSLGLFAAAMIFLLKGGMRSPKKSES
ncbi:MAG: prolipoprotein diacylglyceryl transferase [bacterium]